MIVVIVARDLVEEFLGKLEQQGYLADQLELPMLDQLLATPINGDGAWIYAGQSGWECLPRWWPGGTAAHCRESGAVTRAVAAENRVMPC